MTRNTVIRCGDTVKEAMKRFQAGEEMILFDLETTGLNKNTDRILSFSALKIRMIDGALAITDQIDYFINPGIDIPEEVTTINHISAETVAGCPDEYEAAPVIREYFGENPFVGGYNSVGFDEGFINAMYNRVFGENFTPSHHLDVYLMAKEKLDMPKHKLYMVAHELGADIGIEFHNSLDDCIATFRSMQILLDRYQEAPEPEPVKRVLKVRSASRWTRSHELDRIYVQTVPYTKTYYDIYRKVWCSDEDNVDLECVKADVLAMYGVESEKQLEKVT